MKNYLKTLIALLLALATVFAFVACGGDDGGDGGDGGSGDTGSGDTGNGAGGSGDTGSGDTGSGDSSGGSADSVPGGDVYDDEDDYLIRFVYSYTAKVKNSNGRTENKKEQKTVYTIALPLDNQGFTADTIAEMNSIEYHGYTFDKWYTSWDKTNQKPAGEEFVPGTTPITADITLYGYREAKAGANATFKVETVYIDENGDLTAPILTYPNVSEDELKKYKNLETSDVILTIEGEGAMFNFANANEIDVPWYKYASSVTKIVIGDKITTIGSNSFGGFSRLKTVEIGTGVTVIGEAAFRDCAGKSFTKIDIPANVKTISKNAFYNTLLKEVSLRGVNYIEDSAFKNSNKIKQLLLIPGTMPDGKILLKVAKDAFHPGAVGSSNNTHVLATGKVFYQGDASQFIELKDKLADDARGVYFESGNDVIYDNLDKKATPVVYSYAQKKADLPAGNENGEGYWRYAETGGAVTGIPIQYCFSVQYTMSGNATPIATFYIPVSEKLDKNGNLIVDEDGVPELQALVERKHVDAQEALSYQGYKFTSFTGGALVEGDYIQDDKILTCERGAWLSDDGGIVFAKTENSETKEVTITVSKDEAVETKIIEDEKADFIYNYILDKYNADLKSLEESKAEGDTPSAEELQALKDEYYSDFNHKTAWPRWTNEATVALNEALGNKNSELNKSIADRLYKAFRIWDFESTASTQPIWTGKIADVINIKTLIINEGVEYIGNYTFFGLASITNVILPESIEGINDTAFGGNTKLEYIYYNGVDASTAYYYHTSIVTGENGNVYETAPVLNADNSYVDITVKNKLNGTPAVVYTKASALADNTVPALGSYWCDVTEKKLAWTVEEQSVTVDNVTTVTHNITVGGADEMVDFVKSEDAPWYWVGAKETVTKVTFKDNITKLGKNVLNGYAGVKELKLALNLRSIPADAFVGTDILENYAGAGYASGILVVDGCLLNVDEARMNNKHLDINYGVTVIAEGALARLDKLESVFFASSLLYINSGAFYNDANIKTVYTEVIPAAWATSVAKDVNLSGAATFYNSANAPTAENDELYDFYYKNGNEFVVWGCSHVWGEWIEVTEASCSTEGKMERHCIYDHTHVDYMTYTNENAHKWGAWSVIPATAEDAAHETRKCACGAIENKYLEGVVNLEGATNTVVLPAGQTNWFNVPYSESGFLVIEVEDSAAVTVKHGTKTYASVKYNNEIVLGGKIFVPLNAFNGNEAFVGIDTTGNASVTATINFVSVSDSAFTVLEDGENKALNLEANGYKFVAFEYTDVGYIGVDNPGTSIGVLYNGVATKGGAYEDPDIPGMITYDTNIDVVGAGKNGIALLVIFNTTDAEANITVDIETNKN